MASNKENTIMKNKVKKIKKKTVLLITLAATGLILVGVIVYAWFFYKRQLDTLTWIKTPIRLEIGSGNNHDIAYLDMGSIDADTTERSMDYVFCVYGEPIDMYSLQLAYTTNIPFYYEVYRAQLSTSGQTTMGNIVNVPFTYTDNSGEHTENFTYNSSSTPVISAKPLNQMTPTEITEHQSHNLSYGDENGQNAVDSSKVQKNAEPLYWLASENNLDMLNPRNKGTNAFGGDCFCDYFILRVHWVENTVSNDKETDMVYLTVSR